MQVTVDLSNMFSYSLIPIIVLIILIIAIITLLIINKKKKQKHKIQVIIPPAKDMDRIKNKYLEKIDELITKFTNKEISKRITYQRLSILVRTFIFEVTNVEVQYFTLSEIKELDMPELYELVREYYDPEFSKITKANLIESIEKTKKVIQKWN